MKIINYFILFVISLPLVNSVYSSSLDYDDAGRLKSEEISAEEHFSFKYRDNGQLSQIKSEGSQTSASHSTVQLILPNVQTLTIGDTYTLNAIPSASGNILLYRWDLDGDGTWDTSFTSEPQISHIYKQPGDYPVRLQVKNAEGASHTTSTILRVFSEDKGSVPTAVITSSIGNSASGDIGQAGASIFFSANDSTDPDNDIDSYSWDFGDGSSPRTFRTQNKAYVDPGVYTISLTATDSRGQTHTVQKVITIQSPDIPVAPTISTPLSSYTVTQGELLDIQLDYSDDGSLSQLRFTVSGATGGYIEEELGKPGEMHFRWLPDASQQGTFTIDLTATDGDQLSATKTISVVVNEDSTPSVVQHFVQKVSSAVIGEAAEYLDVSGNYIYVASDRSSKGLNTINIQNPLSPLVINTVNTGKNPYDLDLEDGRIYVARYDKEVYIYSASSAPVLLGKTSLSSSGNFVNVTVDGKTILATNTNGSLWIIDATNAASPVKKSTVEGLSAYYHIQLHPTEKKFYAVSNNKIGIYDYSSLTSPSFVGYISGTENVKAFHVSNADKKLYVGYSYSGNGYLKAFNLSNASSPSLIAETDMEISQTRSITTDDQGNVFFYSGYESDFGCSYTLNYARLVGSSFAKETRTCATDSIINMTAVNGYLYAAQNDDGLVIYQYGEKPNQRPIATNQHITTRWDQSVTIQLSGTDGDGGVLSYDYVLDSVNRGGVTDRYYPTVKYVPPVGYEGEDVFQFTASDGIEASLPGSIAITVIAPPRSPIIAEIGDKTVVETKLLSFGVSVSDPDFQDEVTVSATNLPTGANFDGSNFTWSPDYGAHSASPYVVSFVAADKSGLTDTKQVSISVTRQNQLPVISQFTASPVVGTAPFTTTLSVVAGDPDSDGAIASVTFDYGDGQQGNSSGHTYTTAGTYTVIATVQDNLGGVKRASVGIQVNALKPGTFSLSSNALTVNEADDVVELNILRSGGSDGAATVNYQVVAGTAAPDGDYTSTTQSVNFAQGEVQLPIRIAIVDDERFEGEESFSVVLNSVSSGALGAVKTANILIQDNDVLKAGTVQFTQDNYDVTEQAGGVPITLERTSGSDGALTVNYNVTSGVGAGSDDFVADSGQITFADGELAKTFDVVIKADSNYEGSETIVLTLSGENAGVRKTAQLTILDDDVEQAGSFSFEEAGGGFGFRSSAATSVSFEEGIGAQEITVYRIDGNAGEVSVKIQSVASDTATANEDYSDLNKVLFFADGETSKTVALMILDDNLVEGTEQFKLLLDNPTGGASIDEGELVVNLSDNDNDSGEDNVPDTLGSGVGDGNGDGEADSSQASVTSLMGHNESGWMTYHNTNDGLQNNFMTTASPVSLPDNLHLPLGATQFDIVTTASATVTIELYISRNEAVTDYLSLGNDGKWHYHKATVTHVGNKTKLVFTVVQGGLFDRNTVQSEDGAEALLQLVPGGAVVKTGFTIVPGSYLFGMAELNTSTDAKMFTVTNTGSRSLQVINTSLGGEHVTNYSIGDDQCKQQVLAPSTSCQISVSFTPQTVGSRSATLLINTDDPDNASMSVYLHNHESLEKESARRLPPVLNSLHILDNNGVKVETMKAGASYTVEWSILGYHEDYISSLVMFNCRGVADNTTCGANFTDSSRFLSSGRVDPSEVSTGEWSYNGQTSGVQTFSYTFTTPDYDVETPIVIRFYRLNLNDLQAGNGGLSLVIPGNHASEYYDTTGRRVKGVIVP